uniref:Galectin n=1 Tax=Leptobrachium leishanense TaxID=445787 RepID=A0A8C5Q0D2_9ANUR
ACYPLRKKNDSVLVFTIFMFVDRFSVNFARAPYPSTDIAFHFNPRFDRPQEVIFNTFLSGSWGPEEKKSHPFPFSEEAPFELVFFVKDKGYEVSDALGLGASTFKSDL